MFESNNPTHTTESGAMSGATYTANASTRDADSSGADSDVNRVKPIFMKCRDVPEGKPLLHEEIYIAIHKYLGTTANLKGLQRIGGLWRIYFSDRADRFKLISTGLNIRGVSTPIYDMNPYIHRHDPTASLKLIVKDIPLSVGDDLIINEIERQKCKVVSKVLRMKLRINGQLPECCTGDRMLFIDPILKPLPRFLNMNGFKARIFHEGQEKRPSHCSRGLAQGHHASMCVNDIVCRKCSLAGHKSAECTRDEDVVVVLGKESSRAASPTSGELCSNDDEKESVPHTPDDEIDTRSASQKSTTQNAVAARNTKDTPRAQTKITKFTIPPEETDRGSVFERESESEDDDFQDAGTHEDEEQKYSDMSADSPKLQEGEKKFTSAKRKQNNKSEASKKK